MYICGHISVKQRQLPHQQADFGPWVVQLCKNNSGLYSLLRDTLPPAASSLFSVDNTFGGHFEFLQDNTLINKFCTQPIVLFYTTQKCK